MIIPESGEIVVTATAEKEGAITALSNTINKINTPTLGWQSVNNESVASIGTNVESDAELKYRQTYSTAIPSLSVMEGIVGAVADIRGFIVTGKQIGRAHV